MNILLANMAMRNRSGTECYTFDLALALKRRAHNVIVFSPILGRLAEQLERQRIPVVSDISEVKECPDVIHANHVGPLAIAMLKFDDSPAVFASHGFGIQDRYLPVSRIRRLMPVCSDRRNLLISAGAPPDRISIIANHYSSSDILHRSSPLPARPRTALVVSKRSNDAGQLWSKALRDQGILTEHTGTALGTKSEVFGQHLHHFDLVVASGRSALEAVASGCNVILSERDMCFGHLTTKTFEHAIKLNLGEACMHQPITLELANSILDHVDPEESTALSTYVREHFSTDSLAKELEKIYLDAQSPYQDTPELDKAALLKLLTDYLPINSGQSQLENVLTMKLRQLEQELHRAKQLSLVLDNDSVKQGGGDYLTTDWVLAHKLGPSSLKLGSGLQFEDMALCATAAKGGLALRLPQSMGQSRGFSSIEFDVTPHRVGKDPSGDDRVIEVVVDGLYKTVLNLKSTGTPPFRQVANIDLGDSGLRFGEWITLTFSVVNPSPRQKVPRLLAGFGIVRMKLHESSLPLSIDGARQPVREV